MLPLWKPIKPKDEKYKPLIFNELGQTYGGNKSFRPFIIFFDDNTNYYYYIKAQDKFYKDGKIKKIKDGEVEILQTVSSNGLFTKDSYVDCSQIFKCNKDLLESLIDVNDQLYQSTFNLPNNDILRLKETILSCVMRVPPYLSIVEVKQDDKGYTYGESLYLCQIKYDEVLEKIKLDYYDDDNIHDYTDLISNKNSTFSFQKERYWNGINFCKLFLNEYYPGLVDEFEKIQHLNDDNKENESNSFSQSR